MNETPQPPLSGDTPPPPGGPAYPLRFDVTYPDRALNRVSTGFRIFAAIPIAVVLATVGGGLGWGPGNGTGPGGVLFIPALLMILFGRSNPRGGFDWNRKLLRSSSGVPAYCL